MTQEYRRWTVEELRERRQTDEEFECPICEEDKSVTWINYDRYIEDQVEVCNVCNKYHPLAVRDHIQGRRATMPVRPSNKKEPELRPKNAPPEQKFTIDEGTRSYRVMPDIKDEMGFMYFWCGDCEDYISYSRVSIGSSGAKDGKSISYCDTCRPSVKKVVEETWNAIQKSEAIEPKSKEENTMFNANKLFGGEIGQDNSGRFKLSMMGLAIKTENGYATYDGDKMVDVMDMVMPGMDGGIFKLPVTAVEEDDLIVQGNEVFYVRETREDGSIEALNPLTNKIEVLMPAGNLFGFKFFIKVVSMFDGMFGNTDSSNPLGAIQPFIMMQMFSGGNGLGSLFGGSGSSSKDGGNFMEMFMMMQLFGGGQGGNPFEQMFKGVAAPAQKKKGGRKSAAQKAAEAAEAALQAGKTE